MKKLNLALTISTALASALMLSGTAQADVSDFASSNQTTDRTSADEMGADSDQYYSSSTDASETFSGAVVESSDTNTSPLSRRAVATTDFSGYRTLGSASVIDTQPTQSGSTVNNQNTNQVPNPSIDTAPSSNLGYGINQGNFAPNASTSGSAAPAGSGSAAGTGSTATITAP